MEIYQLDGTNKSIANILIKYFQRKEGKMDPTRIDKCRELMAQVLTLLRAEKREKAEVDGAREVSLALTKFEEGCMWMRRSQFAEKPYNPLLNLQEKKE